MHQIFVGVVLVAAIGLFAWGRIRHDFVALIALFVLVITGTVPAGEAFLGFGHPAVITVAAVLVLSRAVECSGAMDLIGRLLGKIDGRFPPRVLLPLLVAVASMFMNNVGALALMMPVAIQWARRNKESPSLYLMPLAFASLLGGMGTLIGTPPNIIIASYRARYAEETFGMFAYTPVGLVLTAAGLLFLVWVGQRLLPKRRGAKSATDLFDIDDYITEIKIPAKSRMVGLTLGALLQESKAEVLLLGLVRKGRHTNAPDMDETVRAGDILVIETEAEDLKRFAADTDTRLVGQRAFRKDLPGARDIALREAVVMDESPLVGQTAAGLRMRTRYGINLLAVARRQRKLHRRLDRLAFRVGDVLLLQGREHMLDDVIPAMGCLPLAPRGLGLGSLRKSITVGTVFSLAIATIVAGLWPAHVAFSMAAAATVFVGILPVKQFYSSVDWPVIVLLAALLPVGVALETSGAAATLAGGLLWLGSVFPSWGVLVLLMAVTMLLSNVINNAATAVIMAPVAMGLAQGLGVSMDPFLMGVAVAASSAFLTPIGHQSNTLVMAPGGYAFTDYWRLGLPLSIILLVLGVPVILAVWPM